VGVAGCSPFPLLSFLFSAVTAVVPSFMADLN
jgi:hypothetical protein